MELSVRVHVDVVVRTDPSERPPLPPTYLPPPQREMTPDYVELFLRCLSQKEENRFPCSETDAQALKRAARCTSLAKWSTGPVAICAGTSATAVASSYSLAMWALSVPPTLPFVLGGIALTVGVSSLVTCGSAICTGLIPDRSSDANNEAQEALDALKSRIEAIAKCALSETNKERMLPFLREINTVKLCGQLRILTTHKVPDTFFDSLRPE